MDKALDSTETDNESEVLDCNSNCACHLIQSNGVCGEVPVSPRIKEIKREENDKCFIDYREMPIGRTRSLEYAKTIFMKKF